MNNPIYAKDNAEKQRIFDIALALMDDIGYEKMTIRKICMDADISTGKFYHYFNSKQELLTFFYTKANDRFEAECKKTLAGQPLRQQMILFYKWYGHYIESFGVEFTANFFCSNNPAMNTHIYNNPIITITDNLLIDAVQTGYTLKHDQTIREISNDLCVIVKGAIFDWCVRHGEFSLPDCIEKLLNKCTEGIL